MVASTGWKILYRSPLPRLLSPVTCTVLYSSLWDWKNEAGPFWIDRETEFENSKP
jgi:hypothetical protein